MTASFSYRARRATGEVVDGERSAEDRRALADALAQDGLMLVEARRAVRSPRARRVRPSALLSFTRELRHLLAAGLPAAQALRILEARRDDPGLAAAVRGMREGVERGLTLDAAAAEHPGAFDSLFRASLRAGALTGRLPDTLARLERFLILRATLRSRTRRAMTYPAFLLALLAVVVAVLMLFVLPRFAELYAQFGEDLPLATRLLMAAAEAAPWALPLLALAALAAAVATRQALARPTPRRWADRAALGLPILGPVALHLQLVQASTMLSMLLGAGTPLREALALAARSVGNAVVAGHLREAEAGVARGRALSDCLEGGGLLPDGSLSLVRAGEAAGSLPEMLEAVAALHEQELEDRLERLLALIEPVMMLLVGVVLGAVIITVYLPIFGISGVIR
jgi:type IV pilus assembly protein PilC